jgi:ThiF family
MNPFTFRPVQEAPDPSCVPAPAKQWQRPRVTPRKKGRRPHKDVPSDLGRALHPEIAEGWQETTTFRPTASLYGFLESDASSHVAETSPAAIDNHDRSGHENQRPQEERAAGRDESSTWRILQSTGIGHRFALAPVKLQITRAVIDEIESSVGSRRAESGGMLGGSRLKGVVDQFVFDKSAGTTGATYSPNADALNRLLREKWNPAGINMLGFVHSHPVGFTRPSAPDVYYAQQFFQAIPELDCFFMPIVQTFPDIGVFELHPWAVVRTANGPELVRCELDIIEEVTPPQTDCNQEQKGKIRRPLFKRRSGDADPLARTRDAYDTPLLASSRVVVFGAGGAAQWAEDMVRAGIGELVLVDPDLIETRNIGTQQVTANDVGRSKVGALMARLQQVNPEIEIITVQAFDHDLPDGAFERLATSAFPGRVPPRTTLICGFTDSFDAQARISRRALRLGLPSMAAQVYEGGAGAEVTFAVPGRTPACQRCALGGRYRAKADDPNAGENVGSFGTPIWATSRLNSLKGMIATAIIHAADPTPSTHPRAKQWRSYFDAIADRNLVQIRLWPDLAERVGVKSFDRAFSEVDPTYLHADDTVWLRQDPENPETGFVPCADCGGTGNLLDSIGYPLLGER